MRQYDIGGSIKEKRTELKLSQEQLAFLAGITPTYLGQIERGERNPTIGLLEKIAHALHIDICCFFGQEAAPTISSAESRILYALADLNDKQKQAVAQVVSTMAAALKDIQS